MIKTSNKLNYIFVILCILVVAIFSGYLIFNQGKKEENNNNNDIINFKFEGNDFQFYLLNGSIHNLSFYTGKIVIVDLWATWCSPCVSQMSELKKIYDEYSRDELEIVSINIEPGDTAYSINQFKSDFANYFGYSLNWVFAKEKDSMTGYMPQGGIPTIIIFKQNGKKYFSNEGVCYFDEIPLDYPSNLEKPPLLKNKIEELLD